MEHNFESRVKHPPFTMYDNDLIQKETIFKNANQKLCYMYLVSYSNASRIFPSMDSIAAAICTTPRTAMTVIQQLEELGLIEVIRTSGLSNQYILNDYFEVSGKLTRENFSPVKNFHETRENFSPVPVKNFHPKNKTIKTKTKNKISSRESIDTELKNKYPKTPFDNVKEQVLSDDSLTIETDRQYKSVLEYRLKNWKANNNKKNSKKNDRQDKLPSWMTEPKTDSEQLSKETEDYLENLLNNL